MIDDFKVAGSDFGRTLWTLRREKNISQKGMVAMLQQEGFQIDLRGYAEIEVGIRPVSTDESHAIQKTLGVTWRDLNKK